MSAEDTISFFAACPERHARRFTLTRTEARAALEGGAPVLWCAQCDASRAMPDTVIELLTKFAKVRNFP